MTESFDSLYNEMMKAIGHGEHENADQIRNRIEVLRQRVVSKPTLEEIEGAKDRLSIFALSVLGKNQQELGSVLRANCINAAFNFHDREARFETYSTLEFLERLKQEFSQTDFNQLRQGDLIVAWSRNGGSWDNRAIQVHEMGTADKDFPYGLIFDHVMIYLGDGLVFHKPDPSLESQYQIDFLDSVLVTTKENRGFELTFHRYLGRPI